jgi:hypothetical protein
VGVCGLVDDDSEVCWEVEVLIQAGSDGDHLLNADYINT